MSEGSISDR
jgi:hypothetical protein